MYRRYYIRDDERGFLFRRGEFREVLPPGTYGFVDPLRRSRVDIVSTKAAWIEHDDLDVIARSGRLGEEAEVLDLKGRERALVWIDGRFNAVLKPGLYAIWRTFRQIEVEVIDARALKLVRDDLPEILKDDTAPASLVTAPIESGHVGVLYINGEITGTLSPGVHAFWKDAATVRVTPVDLREQTLNLIGQDVMTRDKVSVRLNVSIAYKIFDAVRSLSANADSPGALHRSAQLALRESVVRRDLDDLLASRDQIGKELQVAMDERARELGVEVRSAGIRDVILPGEMKELMNKVTEARKAAEAALITRREETAAMRSQANTARILEANPTLMRLRELEVLERIASSSNLQVVLGQQGLTDRIVKMI